MAKKNGKKNEEEIGSDESGEVEGGEVEGGETAVVESGKTATVLARTSLNWHDPDDLTIIGLDTPHKRGEHPLWQKRAFLPVDEGFVDDMTENGFHDPVIVRRDGTSLIVVDGRQRVKTARAANKRLRKAGSEPIQISSLPPQKGEDGDMVGLMIGLNEHRTEVDIIERARSVVDFMKYGRTEAQAATRLGVSVQVVKNMLKTLECDPTIIKAAEDGDVAPSVLMTLSELSREDQLTEFAKMQAEGKLTVAETQRRVYNKKNGTSKGESEDSGSGKKLPIPVIRKILKLHEKGQLETDVDPVVIQTLKLLDGAAKPSTIKGMTGVLRQVGYFDE